MQLAIEKQKAVQFKNELILMKSKLDQNLQAASAISIDVSRQPSLLPLASTIPKPIQIFGMPYATSNYAPGVSTTFLSTVYSLPISSMSLNNTPVHNVSTMLTLSNAGTGTATALSMGIPINSIASTSTTSSTNTILSSTMSTIYGVKLQKFKPTNDMETFVNRFEQYCLTQKIELIDKANLIIYALDDATFTVIQRELVDIERMNYDTVKQNLLKRFDVHKEIGQKRLLFRQAKHEATQTLEEFYSHLLGLAAKTFPDESAETIDHMITDQLIVGFEVDRIRLHLIEKRPRTSREALAFGIVPQTAIQYNESLKDTSTVSAVHLQQRQTDQSQHTEEDEEVTAQAQTKDIIKTILGAITLTVQATMVSKTINHNKRTDNNIDHLFRTLNFKMTHHFSEVGEIISGEVVESQVEDQAENADNFMDNGVMELTTKTMNQEGNIILRTVLAVYPALCQ